MGNDIESSDTITFFLRISIHFPMLMVPLKMNVLQHVVEKINILSFSFLKNHCTFLTGTRRNNDAIATSKRRRGVVLTS